MIHFTTSSECDFSNFQSEFTLHNREKFEIIIPGGNVRYYIASLTCTSVERSRSRCGFDAPLLSIVPFWSRSTPTAFYNSILTFRIKPVLTPNGIVFHAEYSLEFGFTFCRHWCSALDARRLLQDFDIRCCKHCSRDCMLDEMTYLQGAIVG